MFSVCCGSDVTSLEELSGNKGEDGMYAGEGEGGERDWQNSEREGRGDVSLAKEYGGVGEDDWD